MPKLILTKHTITELQAQTLEGHTFVSNAEPRNDGTFDVPLSVHTWELLDERRLAGESDDDLVMRVLREATGRRPS
jgi:hypothetical protein